MPIFYRKAYEAACGGSVPSGLTDEHFDNWSLLAKALDWLTPEQRCNAIYGDWLLQLHSPAHVALLQVCDLLKMLNPVQNRFNFQLHSWSARLAAIRPRVPGPTLHFSWWSGSRSNLGNTGRQDHEGRRR